MVVGGSTSDGDWDIEAWVDGDRCRIDSAGTVRVQDHDKVVTYTPGYGATVVAASGAEQPLALPDLYWRPRPLIGSVEIESVSDCMMLGRPCWQVDATRDLARHPMVQLMMPGDRFAFTVDQETGVVLRTQEWWGDAMLSSTDWTLFELLDGIDDSVFENAIPADVIVKSQVDVARDHARAIGVDLSGVDVDDVDQIAAAIRTRRRSGLLDHHVATGSPPADIEGAGAEIRHAFTNLSEEDGDSLPNVQSGDALAPTVRRAAARWAGGGAAFSVSEIKFLSAERAVVVFSISTDRGHLLGDTVGEAVLHGTRWRVARSTFGQLMRMAGVEPPPLPE